LQLGTSNSFCNSIDEQGLLIVEVSNAFSVLQQSAILVRQSSINSADSGHILLGAEGSPSRMKEDHRMPLIFTPNGLTWDQFACLQKLFELIDRNRSTHLPVLAVVPPVRMPITEHRRLRLLWVGM